MNKLKAYQIKRSKIKSFKTQLNLIKQFDMSGNYAFNNEHCGTALVIAKGTVNLVNFALKDYCHLAVNYHLSKRFLKTYLELDERRESMKKKQRVLDILKRTQNYMMCL